MADDTIDDPVRPASPAFTVLLPVHRGPAMLPYAIESVLAQTHKDLELFIVCDGAPDDTVAYARGVAARDARVKVFPFAKGPFCGEAYRHIALMDARGRYVAHIADDDLWFPHHLEELEKLLLKVDFGHTLNTYVTSDGGFDVLLGDLAGPKLRQRMLREEYNVMGDTVTGYRLAAYRQLPEGWATPPGPEYPDLRMWRKFLSHDTLSFGTRFVVTALVFPTETRHHMSMDERAAEVRRWHTRLQAAEERYEILQEVWRSIGLHVLQMEDNTRVQLDVIRTLEEQVDELARLAGHRLRGGCPIDFSRGGNSALYTDSGWSSQEPHFRWTLGKTAVVRVRLDVPDDQMPCDWIIRLRATAFGGAQRVVVRVDQDVATEFTLDGEWRDYMLDFPGALANHEHVIVFHLPDAQSPKSLGLNEDHRELGMALASIDVTPRTADADRTTRGRLVGDATARVGALPW